MIPKRWVSASLQPSLRAGDVGMLELTLYPPAVEAEAVYYRQLTESAMAA